MKFNPMIFLTDLKTFFPMVWAILRRRYKMPWNTFFWGILCFVYVVSPIDILPDVMPILGITDDGAFIILVLSLLHQDLAAFRQFQTNQTNLIEAEVIHTNQTCKK
ncbi:MAG: DUF1232 domain-containing protein [Elusimicrobiaceae bacterium]|nr:DUF1232 domain-containing protein [Elusimicrobiaceae bacterium]